MNRRRRRAALAVVAAAACVIASCGGGGDDAVQFDAPGPTDAPPAAETAPSGSTTAGSAPVAAPVFAAPAADVEVTVDATTPGEPISPLILGLSSSLTPDQLQAAGITMNSWGGNPATRFNYLIGHVWNNGADYEFRNTNFGGSGDTSRDFLRTNQQAGVASRLAVPTLGWVAKNDDTDTCSFPAGAGTCLNPQQVGSCSNQKELADPATANVVSTPEMVADWVAGLVADGLQPRFVAMDNEPELWGGTHYDVHPECTTYEEILDEYLTYASAIRAVAPDAELTGPVMCCWYDYWNIAPGPVEGPDQDFLEWFLQKVREHDEQTGTRTIDVVDVHFYPQSEVFNDNTDPETNARRLRSVHVLYDPKYVDESWIDQPIWFIPRMKKTIEKAYPGLPLMISEWNFGADKTINGALAIADVLGVYGREGVYAASYWRNPDVGSPGAFAFTMHGNYDGQGSRFGGRVVDVTVSDQRVSAYGALDEESGVLRLMLINTDPDAAVTVGVGLSGFTPATEARTFSYGPDDLTQIVSGTHALTDAFTLPASSITVVELDPSG